VPTRLFSAKDALMPATASGGTAELMACLTLVAPSGMSAEDRNAWVQVARATLSGIPADLLAIGCKIARRKCRFASEIVPTILESTESQWNARIRRLSEERWSHTRRLAPPPKDPEYVDPAEVRKLIRSIG
jgi:hypothetical protein